MRLERIDAGPMGDFIGWSYSALLILGDDETAPLADICEKLSSRSQAPPGNA